MKFKKVLAAAAAALLVASSAMLPVSAGVNGESKGQVPKVNKGDVVIDAQKDAIYDQGLMVKIDNWIGGPETGVYGDAHMLWTDGLWYLFVAVHDSSVAPPDAGMQANSPWMTDSVEMFFDFGNAHDELVRQFRVDCSGYPSYYVEGGVEQAYGPENAAPYFGEYAVALTDYGYNVEMAVDIDKYNIREDESIGLQLQINDMPADDPAGGTITQAVMPSKNSAGSWDHEDYDFITLGTTISAPAETPVETPVETPAETTPDAPVTTPAAQTSDIGAVAALAAAAAAVVIFAAKKRAK